jgi:hypothetical protein
MSVIKEKFLSIIEELEAVKGPTSIGRTIAGLLVYWHPEIEEDREIRRLFCRFLQEAIEELRETRFTREYFERNFIDRGD